MENYPAFKINLIGVSNSKGSPDYEKWQSDNVLFPSCCVKTKVTAAKRPALSQALFCQSKCPCIRKPKERTCVDPIRAAIQQKVKGLDNRRRGHKETYNYCQCRAHHIVNYDRIHYSEYEWINLPLCPKETIEGMNLRRQEGGVSEFKTYKVSHHFKILHLSFTNCKYYRRNA